MVMTIIPEQANIVKILHLCNLTGYQSYSLVRLLYIMLPSYCTMMTLLNTTHGVTGVTPERLRSNRAQYYARGMQP
jgi:hypothetical protein